MTRVLVVASLLGACGTGPDQVMAARFCAVPVEDSPVRGPSDARVTVVEFADFECPYCARAEPMLKQADEQRPGLARLVFKHLPLPYHARALAAAVAAECAHEQARFWPMHDLIYAHRESLSDADLSGYAEQLGLDLETWEQCRVSSRPLERVARDQAQAEQAQVRATPTFFVNGRPVVGLLPLAQWLELVDAAAEAAENSGLAGEAYYADLEGRGCS